METKSSRGLTPASAAAPLPHQVPSGPTRPQHVLDSYHGPRKLIIFTEHRDTLNYLTQQIRNVLVPMFGS